MPTLTSLSHLTEPQLEEFGRELDAMREEVMDARGETDRRYILTLIRVQRSCGLAGRFLIFAGVACLPAWNHALASTASFACLIGLGTLLLLLDKILENMEIGHNVLHGQWDWMQDPDVQSNTWEWNNVCPADQWMHSHNVVHHTWTNVLGKDRDIGYGMLRITKEQRWHPFYLMQPISAVVMALFFEWFIALHDLEINRLVGGRKDWVDARLTWREIRRKALRQSRKDYLMWPLLGMLLALPFSLANVGPPLYQVGLWVLGANITATILRNVWLFIIIVCGHFPAGVHHFAKSSVDGETRAHWYVRQLLGSCNIRGGRLFHVLSGNLSHQIEHHLFPDMPSNRYPEVAPRVQALADRYGLPYNSGSLGRQLGTTTWKILRLTFPGGAT